MTTQDRLRAAGPSTHQMHVLREIIKERHRQDAKHGQPPQRRLDGTGPQYKWRADVSRERTDAAAGRGEETWMQVLTEEFWEAMAEGPLSPELRHELIQVAAVCVSWIEDIDRKTGQVPL